MIRWLSTLPSQIALIPFLCLLYYFLAASQTACAFTPEDPEVRAMVDRGLRYLEAVPANELGKAAEGGPGQIVLASYAHFKAEHDPDAAIVKLGLATALSFAEKVKTEGKLVHETKTTYEVAVAILFLAEYDPQQYAPQLKLLGDGLIGLQQSHGGYGYPGQENGDVSQTQYVVLAMWTLDRAGIDVPLDRVKKTLHWLSRVQDPSGQWPYLGKYPGPSGPLIEQPKLVMTISTSLAGASSALIAADTFRLWGSAKDAPDIENFPKALKLVEATNILLERQKKSPLAKEAILEATSRMDRYRSTNPYVREPGHDWYYYMIYTMERYESFLELSLGKTSTGQWYDEVVRNLQNHQSDSGGWGISDKNQNTPVACTSFAILFLIRGTKKAITASATGSMAGGYTLPADTTKIVVDGTQIKAEPVASSVTDLLDILETEDSGKTEAGSIPENLKLETDPAKRKIQIARLERVLRGSRSWQARRVAARLLGNSDEHSVVPTLIYAISDPDKPTRTYAINGLQFISRRFNDFDAPPDADSEEMRRIQQEWIRWYQTLYPGAVLLDFGFD